MTKGPQVLRLYARLPDTVQWALYYPPLTAGGSVPLSPDLAEASHLLARGRVDEALPILCAEPIQGEKSALLAIVELTRNDPLHHPAIVDACGRASVRDNRQRALDFAEQAVRSSPRSAAAWISLSYARQAHAKLDDARAALEQAVTVDPNDALARARLAEIWLSLGYRDRALKEAERAKELSPTLSRTQTVYGFAALAEIDLDRAQRAFASAIERDTADPLPRLGLGLLKICKGEITAGRRELEIATGLDPQNSLIRSYLGKAYFEEKRDPLDAEQLAMAKELDPLDPTPWLYDAIRLQTENRPGEALQAIQKSIELNDNRAIYRSRQGLDQDRAARGTSQARIYDDLGFQQLGVDEASQSLTLDPANAAAHRLLSDIYSGVRRREIARVSELLQAQLLQDININPVQPSISETNLNMNTRGGPAEIGFNEFTPLFERNDAQLNASGLVGNNDTFGGEGVVSALYDKFSISAGAFHYETDGWRPNNAINHDIYNVYAQGAITPELNLQVEYRHRESDNGDLAFNFNPNSFNPLFDRRLNQDIGRLGLRYSPTPNSDLLLSFIYSDRDEDQGNVFPGFSASVDDQGYQIEAQYLYRREWLNLTAGFGNTGIDFENQFYRVSHRRIGVFSRCMDTSTPTSTSRRR